MRVLAVTNLYPNPAQPHRAPFNRHQLRLLNESHPVRVVAPVAWTDELRVGRFPRRTTLDGIAAEHPRYVFPPRVGRGWYGHCFRWSVRRAFAAAVREFAPDVVFAPWAYPDGWAAGRLAKEHGLPCVVQVHGSDVRLAPQSSARLRRTREALCAADAVVAVSRDLADRVVDVGVEPDRVTVNIDGVDLDLFRPESKAAARAKLGLGGGPTVLFVGNLLPVKGVDVLLAAAAALPDVRTLIVGQGPLRGSLERQASSLGIADRVRFVGPVPLADLPDWYRAADVFALASRSEGVPNVLLEAAACGTPWVATRVGGVPEVAHLGHARLVPPENPNALAAAIRDALADPPASPGTPPRLRSAAVADLAAALDAVARPRTVLHLPAQAVSR